MNKYYVETCMAGEHNYTRSSVPVIAPDRKTAEAVCASIDRNALLRQHTRVLCKVEEATPGTLLIPENKDTLVLDFLEAHPTWVVKNFAYGGAVRWELYNGPTHNSTTNLIASGSTLRATVAIAIQGLKWYPTKG